MPRKSKFENPAPLTLSNVPDVWRYEDDFFVKLSAGEIVGVHYSPVIVECVPGDERAPFDPYFEFRSKRLSDTGFLRYDIPRFSNLEEIATMPAKPADYAAEIAQRLADQHAKPKPKSRKEKMADAIKQTPEPQPQPGEIKADQILKAAIQKSEKPNCPKCGHPKTAHQHSKKAKRDICMMFDCNCR